MYCDFLKAFDKVPHHRLLEKLYIYGLPEYLIRWIRGFLLDRRQRVIIQGTFSDWRSVLQLSGIPQGSVLRPLLFVLYINCLPDQVQQGSSVYLFADDTKIFKPIFNQENCRQLQQDITDVVTWTEESLLKLHPDKCKYMRICQKNSQCPDFTYSLGNTGKDIAKVSQEKDLGVIIDDTLSFDQHINEKINTANRVLGTIRRTFSHLDKDNFNQLYKSLVRPHLEFANQIWVPHLKKHTEALENVQRCATRMLPGVKELAYPDRLRKLKLPSLTYRRLRGDRMEMFKILTGKYDSEVSNFVRLSNQAPNTRDHSLKIAKLRPNTTLHKFSFTTRCTDTWNNLPDELKAAPSCY